MRFQTQLMKMFYDDNYNDIQKKLNNKVIFMDTNVRLSNSKCTLFSFFLRRSCYNLIKFFMDMINF